MRTLVLLKGAPTRAQLVENLRVMQDPELTELTLSMSQRRLPTGWSVSSLDGVRSVLVCLAEGEAICPVRFGELVECSAFPGRTEVRVRCGAFPAGVLADLAAQVKSALPAGAGLVLLDLADGLVRCEPVPDPSWWRGVVEAIGVTEPYQSTLFYRRLSVEVEGQQASVAVEVYSPHLRSHETPGMALTLVDATSQELLGRWEGTAGSPVVFPLPAGPTERRCELQASPLRHFSLAETVMVPAWQVPPPMPLVVEPEAPTEGTHPQVTARTEAFPFKRLWQYLKREANLGPDVVAQVLTEFGLPALPGDLDLIEDLATNHLSRGKPEEAFALLKDLPVGELSPAAALVLFRAGAALQAHLAYEELLPHLDLSGRHQAEALSAAIAVFDERMAAALLDRLVEPEPLIDPAVMRSLLSQFPERFREPYSILRFAWHTDLFFSADDACAYLARKWDEFPHLGDHAGFLEEYWQYAVRAQTPTGISRLLRELSAHCIRTGKTERLYTFFSEARTRMTAENRRQFYDHLFHLLSASEEMLVPLAAMCALELTEFAILDADLEVASEWLIRLEALPVADAALRQRVDSLAAEVRRALEKTEFYRQFLAFNEEALLKRLRSQLQERTVIVVGGWKQEYAEELVQQLGLRRLDWVESERNQRVNFEPVVAALKQGAVAAVVLVYTHCGHDAEFTLKPVCVSRSIPYQRAQLGRRSLLMALAQAVLPA